MRKSFFTISDLFNLSGSVIYNPDSYRTTKKVEIDSRKVTKGSIFVAIKGEKFDGHDFVDEAIKNGAKAIIVNSKKLKKFEDLEIPIITVPDTTIAFGELARVKREKLNYKIIGITGSNGKTSTKDILTEILSAKFIVYKTQANNNNHIGVPLTIMQASSDCEVLILELGTNHFGEIDYISKIAQPDYGLITNIGKSHLEFLVDENGVLNEKIALFSVVNSKNGTIFLNIDDKKLAMFSNKFEKVITISFEKEATYKFEIQNYDEFGFAEFTLTTKGEKSNFKSSLVGETNVKNLAFSIAIALEMGLSISEIKKAIKNLQVTKGRFEQIKMSNFLLIDDTYNSNPNSVKGGLENLKHIKIPTKKILILGDMFELGENSQLLHQELSKTINSVKFSEIYLIGKLTASLQGKLKAKHYHFNTITEFLSEIGKINFSDSVVYVKGSRGMRMEQIVNYLKQELK